MQCLHIYLIGGRSEIEPRPGLGSQAQTLTMPCQVALESGYPSRHVVQALRVSSKELSGTPKYSGTTTTRHTSTSERGISAWELPQQKKLPLTIESKSGPLNTGHKQGDKAGRKERENSPGNKLPDMEMCDVNDRESGTVLRKNAQ